jgi:uncharacterized protein YcbK (DUF882 family)
VTLLKVRRQKRRRGTLARGTGPVYASVRMRRLPCRFGRSAAPDAAAGRASGTVAVLALSASLLAPASAWADVTHIVQRGHTLEAIAHRYHVTVEAIVQANHLKDGEHLRPGQELVIPGVDAPESRHGHKGAHDEQDKDEEESTHSTHGARASAANEKLEPRGHHPKGVINATRAGEEFHIRVNDTRGHISEKALREFAQMSRQGNATHPPDPRLVALIGIVSDHFGGRTLEIVSGYRAYTPTQYTPHSNHNYGKALDFRVEGIPNEALRDFCRTLRNTGCGYYPNSTFVHLDARDSKAYWVDWSHPGEPPQYEKPGVQADEGASDVPDEKAPSGGSAAPSPSGGSANTPPTMPLNDTVQSL